MILVSGAGGFIGRHVVAALGDAARPLSHTAATDPTLYAGIRAVVHAGRNPLLGKTDYRLEDDAELAIARLAATHDLPFLSLGSRKVYAPSDQPLAEDARIGPTDRYGERKLALEEALLASLGERLTRLRLANIFGAERGRTSFMGLMLRGLESADTISFDMSPFVRRDFLPVETTARAIAALAHDPPGSIVNIGSGVPLEVGRLALAVIEGRGQGRLLVTDPSEHDAFTLNTAHLHRLTGITTDTTAILAHARVIGRSLGVPHATANP